MTKGGNIFKRGTSEFKTLFKILQFKCYEFYTKTISLVITFRTTTKTQSLKLL